ncbi:MAG: hypothetical protein EBU88_14620, partial [Acidobacteria bacterium]|nr:hypothetical protein [Acidobacteriota bacterium]
YGFYTDQRLQARNPFDLTLRDAPAQFTLRKCTPPAQFCDTGAAVRFDGRPLVVPNPVGGENPLTQGQFGGIISGPLTSRGTNFFASIERRIMNASRESNFAVPTVSQRGLFDSGDIGLTGRDKNGAIIEAYPTSAAGDQFYSLFPFPNNPRGPYGDNTFTRILPADARGDLGSVRLDQDLTLFNQRQYLAARYNITDDRTALPVTGEAIFSSMKASVRTQNFSFNLGGSINSQTRHELRFSFGRTRLDFAELRGPYNDFLLASKVRSAGREVPFLLNARYTANNTFPGDVEPKYDTQTGDSEGNLASGDGTGPIGQVILSGFSSLGVDVNNFPQRRVNNTFQIAETVGHNVGRHSIIWGGDLRRVQLNSQLDRNFRPVVHFSGVANTSLLRTPVSNNQLINRIFQGTDLIALGAPTGFTQTLSFNPDSTIGLRLWQSSLFFEDTISITPGLRLVMGLRYELNSVPREVNDRIENTFRSGELGKLIAAEKSSYNVSGLEAYLQGRTGIYEPDRNNFAPHIAFAWDPFQTGNTVIRGGYGIYFDQIPGVVISQSRSVFPTFLTFNTVGLRNPANLSSTITPFNPSRFAQAQTLNQLDNKFGSNSADVLLNLLGIIQSGSSVNFPYIVTPNFVLPEARLKTPSSHQWGLTLERSLTTDLKLSLAYVGTKGTNLIRFATPNLGPRAIPVLTDLVQSFSQIEVAGDFRSPGANVSKEADLRRPYPLTGALTLISSDANSIYHSLQAEASRRLTKGLGFTLAYTWSHAIDEVSDIFDLAGA